MWMLGFMMMVTAGMALTLNAFTPPEKSSQLQFFRNQQAETLATSMQIFHQAAIDYVIDHPQPASGGVTPSNYLPYGYRGSPVNNYWHSYYYVVDEAVITYGYNDNDGVDDNDEIPSSVSPNEVAAELARQTDYPYGVGLSEKCGVQLCVRAVMGGSGTIVLPNSIPEGAVIHYARVPPQRP